MRPSLLAKRSRSRAAAVLAASVLAFGVATIPTVANGQAPVAPPDLSTMVLQPADMPAGTKVVDDGAIDYPGATAAYGRTFVPPHSSGVRTVVSEVALMADPGAASTEYANLDAGLRTPALRRVVGRQFAHALWGRVRGVRVSRLHAGGASAPVSGIVIRATRGHVRMTGVFACTHVDRLFGMLLAGGTNRRATTVSSRRYLSAMIAHMGA